MSLEKGGRADKLGNRYENRFLAKLLIRLVEEKIVFLEVEPLGETGDGVEYIAEYANGKTYFYQCKASNKTATKWTVADLQRLNIFDKARKHVLRNTNNEYHFISPLPYEGIADLCDRARTNHSLDDFLQSQLTNAKLRNAFSDLVKHFNIDIANIDEVAELVHLLSQWYFELIPDNNETLMDLEARVNRCFQCNAKVARMQLENVVNDQTWYGKKLDISMIVSYMNENGFLLREYGRVDSVLERIRALNSSYWDEYTPINGKLIHRDATTKIIDYLEKGQSIVLHGGAGTGKSGCIEEVIQRLKSKHVPYLCLKLDKLIPEKSADEYGKELDLPESPVYCLHKVAANSNSVLILDQLDSLRWTAMHSSTALSACKEMIMQMRAINMKEAGRVSILFVTRTFDYKNDNGIKQLFKKEDATNSLWNEIEITSFSEKEVKALVGNEYDNLSYRLKNLLRTPASLFVWSQLDSEDKRANIVSANQLMEKWWEKILKDCQKGGLLRSEVENIVNNIAEQMNQIGVFSLPRRLFSSNADVLDTLISAGLFSNNPHRIAFNHQSFFDYFIATNNIFNILAGKRMTEILPDIDAQTPNLRYRWLSVLQGLLEVDEQIFIEKCNEIMEADGIRYYYKCAVFEAVVQCREVSECLLKYAKKCLLQEEWHEYVWQTVYHGNSTFIKSLGEESYDWMSEEGLLLLKSINRAEGDFVTSILEPYCFKNEEMTRKVYNCLCRDVSDDTETMYLIRKRILKNNDNLLNNSWYLFYHAFENAPERAVDLLVFLLESPISKTNDNFHFPDSEVLELFAQKNADLIINRVLDVLFKQTEIHANSIEEQLCVGVYEPWTYGVYGHKMCRKILEIVKFAVSYVGKNEPEKLKLLIEQYRDSASFVLNELILEACKYLDSSYADLIIEWLSDDFPNHIFDYTGSPVNYLISVKGILSNLLPHCNEQLFEKMESIIVCWKDGSKRMVELYKHRIEINKQKKWKPIYYAYWGHMQKELLAVFPADRMSEKAKEILAVVTRNSWIKKAHYKSYLSIGEAKNVISPVSNNPNDVTDGAWLRIVSTPNEKMNSNKWRETATAYIETNHFTFSAAMASAARVEPRRFVSLLMKMPEDCYTGYISGVIRAIRDADKNVGQVDSHIICEVIRKYKETHDEQIKCAICDLIESRSEDDWPDDVLQFLIKTTLSQDVIQRKSKDDSDQSLYMETLNTAKGCAIRAMASLIWKKEECANYFKEVILKLADSLCDVVHFALISCVVAYYNTDPDFSVLVFRRLLNKSVQILQAPNVWEIIIRDYNNSDLYKEKIMQACETDSLNLVKRASGFACALAVYCDDQQLLCYLLNHRHEKDGAEEICRQATHCFTYPEHVKVSKKILLEMIQGHELNISLFGKDFFENHIEIERDKDFLLDVFNSNLGKETITSFLDFINHTEKDIKGYAELINIVALKIYKAPEDYSNYLMIEDLIEAVIKLFDIGSQEPSIRIMCLNIWDQLFLHNIQDVKPLAEMLDVYH